MKGFWWFTYEQQIMFRSLCKTVHLVVKDKI